MFVSWAEPARSPQHDFERRLDLLRQLPSILQS
jgi:hypothetical protein